MCGFVFCLVVVDGLVLVFINFLGFVCWVVFCCLLVFWVLFWLCRKKKADTLVLLVWLFVFLI